MCTTLEPSIVETLKRFWELEEISLCNTPDNQFCERKFVDSTIRTQESRYVVDLPFKENADHLWDSYQQALRGFRNF